MHSLPDRKKDITCIKQAVKRSVDVQNALEANANNTEPGRTPVEATKQTSISVICEFEYRSVRESHFNNINSRIRLSTGAV
jgi:hypothetical protein